jgi:hypothetical protein
LAVSNKIFPWSLNPQTWQNYFLILFDGCLYPTEVDANAEEDIWKLIIICYSLQQGISNNLLSLITIQKSP